MILYVFAVCEWKRVNRLKHKRNEERKKNVDASNNDTNRIYCKRLQRRRCRPILHA